MISLVHVAVAVIINSDQEVLLALRHSHQHQGDLWEFPGGKVEKNEPAYDGLVREIEEELDLHITSAEPFIEIAHDYSDKSVLLDVWTISEFEGTPRGKEGQILRWAAIANLEEQEFPAANVAIINALKLRVRP
ncbi:MAG: 8-oxo-dGTP diphosphatase MutT [Methylophaga sp.]|nr:8-oxo-dGTP diphosphatase MutT [Methylophaga sp.]